MVGRRMVGMTGKRQYWVELLCLGMGLPLVFTLVLAGFGVSSRVSSDSVQGADGRSPAAGDWAADTTVTVKIAGWRLLVDGSPPEFSSIGPVLAAEPFAGAVHTMPRLWAVAPAAAALSPRFYRPQAPPSRA